MASEKVVDDPNFAIICAFLHKFAPICGIEHPDVQEMQTMLEDMEEVAPELMDLHIKLMRKTKYSVRPDKWERTLVKFSHSFSNVDAWELEKFGYKKLRLPVRLRILKALLETQFDSNMRFKTAVNGIAANELRPQPLGRDKEGNSYWSTLDQKCNLRIYQEHLDEETWRVVATSRDELVKLIAVLNGNEPVVPNLEGLVDEDSSSNSNGLLLKGEHVLVKQDSNSTSLSDDTLLLRKKPQDTEAVLAPEETEKKPEMMEDEKKSSEESSEEEEEEDEETPEPPEKVPPQIIKLEGHKNKYNKPSLVSSFAKKESPRCTRSQRYSKRLAGSYKDEEEEKLSIPDTVLKRPKVERLTLLGKSNLDKINKFKKMDSKKQPVVEEDSSDEDDSGEEEEEEEEEQEEEESEDEEEEEFSEPIEERVMIVKGSGSGKECEGGNPVFECSETVEEETFYVFGEGSGADCDVGNTKDEEKSPTQSKPKFFFGQPGCLKLSPMKQTVSMEFGFGQTPAGDEASESSNSVNDKKDNCENAKGESSKEDVESNKEDALSVENDINEQKDCQTDVEKVNEKEEVVENREEEVRESPAIECDPTSEGVVEQDQPKAEVLVAESPSKEEIVKENNPPVKEITEQDQPKGEDLIEESPSEENIVKESDSPADEVVESDQLETEVSNTDSHSEEIVKENNPVSEEVVEQDQLEVAVSIAESPPQDIVKTDDTHMEEVAEKDQPESGVSFSESQFVEKIVKEIPVSNISPIEMEKSREEEIIEQEIVEKVDEIKITEETSTAEEETSHPEELPAVEEPNVDVIPMKEDEKVPEVSEAIERLEAEKPSEENSTEQLSEIPEECANISKQDVLQEEEVAEPMETEEIPVNPEVEAKIFTPEETPMENEATLEDLIKPEDPVPEVLEVPEQKEVEKDLEVPEEETPMEVDEPSSSSVLFSKDDPIQESIPEVSEDAQIPSMDTETHKTPEIISNENKQSEESVINEADIVENLPDSAENNLSENELIIDDDESSGDKGKVFTEEELLEEDKDVELQVVPEKVPASESESKIDTTEEQEKVQEDSLMESTSKEAPDSLDLVTPESKMEEIESTENMESESMEDKPSEPPSVESPKPGDAVSVGENVEPVIEEVEEIEQEDVLPEEEKPEKVDSPKVSQSVEAENEEVSLEKNLHEEEFPPEDENVCENDPASEEVLSEVDEETLQSENVASEPSSMVIADQVDEVCSEELKEPTEQPAAPEEGIQTTSLDDKQGSADLPEQVEVPQETLVEEEKTSEEIGLEIKKAESPKTFELQSQESAEVKELSSEENQKVEVLEGSTSTDEPKEMDQPPKSPEAQPVLVSQTDVVSEENLLNDTEEISDDEDGFEDPPLETCPEDKTSVPESTCVPMELEELSGSQIMTDPDSSSAPESDKGDKIEETTDSAIDTPMELEDDPGSSLAPEATDLSTVREEKPAQLEDMAIDEVPMELEETEEPPVAVIDIQSALEVASEPEKVAENIQEMPKEEIQEEKPAEVPVSLEASKPDEVNRIEEEKVEAVVPEDLSKSAVKESAEATNMSKEDDEDSLSSPEFEEAISPESDKPESPKPEQPENLSAKVDNNNEMKVSEKPCENEALDMSEVKTVVQAKTYFPECSAVESKSLEESVLVKKRRLCEDTISLEKEGEGKRVKVEAEKKEPEEMEVTHELEVPKEVESNREEEKVEKLEAVTKKLIEEKMEDDKEEMSEKSVKMRKTVKKQEAEKKETIEKLPEKKTESILNLSMDYEPPATIIRVGRKTRGRRPIEVEVEEVKPQKQVEEVKPIVKKSVEVKKAKVEEKEEEEDVEAQLEDLIPVSKIDKNQVVAEKEETETKEPAEKKPVSGRGRGRGRGGRRPQNITEDSDRKRSTRRLGLDIDESVIIEENEDQPVVRQSRRIAQLKIREEAERRKLEEVALQKMKEEAIRKKKQEHDDYVPSPDSDSDDEYKKNLEKKKKGAKKKANQAKWHSGTGTSESDEEDGEEEEDGLEPEYVGSPLFKSDHEFSPESDLEDDVGVPTKMARTVRKDPEDDDFEENPEHACQKCGKHDHPEWILLCDSCDKGYHCSCLKPVLFVIPEGDWFCPPCQHAKLLESLNAKLDELDSMIEEKEKEELRQQRLTFNSVSAENIIKQEEEAQKAKSRSRSRSVKAKSSSSSSDDNSSDNEPIYKLRKRRQTNVSYRFNEYDALINSAIKDEIAVMEEGMSPFEEEMHVTAGNLGRGKDISTIIEADKKEKMSQLGAQTATKEDQASDKSESEAEPVAAKNEESSDSEPIRPSGRNKLALKKKNRKLNTLDISSEDDGSDEDFKESSPDSEDSAESLSSGSENSMELELLRKKNRKAGITTRRSVRSRHKVYDEDFINDNDSDEDEPPAKKKKRKKEDSDFSDFDESDEDEDEEDIDSDDLCDDTDSGSDSSDWRSRRKKAQPRKPPRPADKPSNTAKKQPKKKEEDEDTPFRASSKKKKSNVVKSDEEREVTRRTRGKKINFLEDYYDDSSDDGIKPGVKRPDTPPEEREMFIKKQEEIKRMLAAKNTELAKEMATPKLEPLRVKFSQAPESPSPDAAPGVIPSDSISTVPPQVIQTAKALDVDLRPSASATAPASEDFNPEDMNEEELAKMMEDETFAQQQLKLAGEAIRNKKLREAEMNRKAAEAAKEKIEAPLPTPPLAIPVYTPTHQEGSPMLPGQIRIPTAPQMAAVCQQPPHPLQHPILRPTVPMPYPPAMHMQPPHHQLDLRGELDPEHPSVKLTKAGLVPKKRGRKSKLELQALAEAKARADVPFYPGPPQGTPVSLPPSSTHPPTSLPPSTHPVTSQMANMERPSVLQAPNAVVTAAGEPVIPTTVLSVQGTPTPGVTDSKMDLDSSKKRGRRKKITPLRDSIPGGQITTISGAMKGDTEPTTSNPILAERLEAPPATSEASKKVTPPQLYPPGSSGGAILSRLQQQMRPLPGPFGAQGLPGSRYFPSSHHLGHSSLNMSLHHLRANFAGTPSSTAPGSVNNGLGDRPPGLYVSPDQRGVPGPHGIFRGSGPMYPGHGYQGQQSLLHHQLQSLDPSLAIRGPPPQEYQSPYLPPQFGGFYAPPSQAAQPTATTASSVPATTTTPSATTEVSPATTSATATSTAPAAPPYSQFETLKSSSPHENASHSYSNSPAHVEAGGTSEFSGLVSYFSSQQDDLES